MNRRQILSIGLCSAVLPLSGCFTTRLHEDTLYSEKISGVFISSDKKTLAIIGAKYHYILDAPPAILAALDPTLHSSIESASFDSFVVSGDNKMTGKVTLTTRGQLSEEQKKFATNAGFTANGSYGLKADVQIQGTRYQAKPVGKLAFERLNNEYYIAIKEKPSLAETGYRVAITPIAIAADGALVIGIVALSPLWIPMLWASLKGLRK